ncbi:hypothetical protein NDU88_000207 [Pleurodeles waltl]|uniref:Uncharacterized protein n=1 Tax=Pleurodeles waltl TaxID=8319 RepID=A0AAV7U2T7_PLEWA|nr:hypothetical protein NDU88_000207 [Pleurodeles waltl]
MLRANGSSSHPPPTPPDMEEGSRENAPGQRELITPTAHSPGHGRREQRECSGPTGAHHTHRPLPRTWKKGAERMLRANGSSSHPPPTPPDMEEGSRENAPGQRELITPTAHSPGHGRREQRECSGPTGAHHTHRPLPRTWKKGAERMLRANGSSSHPPPTPPDMEEGSRENAPGQRELITPTAHSPGHGRREQRECSGPTGAHHTHRPLPRTWKKGAERMLRANGSSSHPPPTPPDMEEGSRENAPGQRELITPTAHSPGHGRREQRECSGPTGAHHTHRPLPRTWKKGAERMLRANGSSSHPPPTPPDMEEGSRENAPGQRELITPTAHSPGHGRREQRECSGPTGAHHTHRPLPRTWKKGAERMLRANGSSSHPPPTPPDMEEGSRENAPGQRELITPTAHSSGHGRREQSLEQPWEVVKTYNQEAPNPDTIS